MTTICYSVLYVLTHTRPVVTKVLFVSTTLVLVADSMNEDEVTPLRVLDRGRPGAVHRRICIVLLDVGKKAVYRLNYADTAVGPASQYRLLWQALC